MIAGSVKEQVLLREIVPRPRIKVGEAVIVLTLIGFIAGLFEVPRVMRTFRESHEDTAKIIAHQLADEAYPQWAVAHSGCPTVDELVAYVGREDTLDPWGRPYEITCIGSAWRPTVIATSWGQDQTRGTYDDISSNE